MKRYFAVLLTICMIMSLCSCNGPKEVENQSLNVSIEGTEIKGTYTGTIENKVPNGQGIFNSEDGWIFEGEFIEGNLDVGNITDLMYELEYGDKIYEGNYIGGVKGLIPEGEGEFVSKEESFNYSGAWDKGKMSGEGELTVADDVYGHFTYTGEFSNGTLNGYGDTIFNDYDYYKEIGTYTNGEFTPNVFESFLSIGTYVDTEFEINDKSKNFLENYSNIFTQNSIENTEIPFEENFKYEAFAKNPKEFGEKLIQVSGLRIIQISEDTYWGSDRTFLIAEDANWNVYYINMYGFADGIYEGDYITLTALPLDYFTYPNTANNDVWAISCAGVCIAK